MGTPGGTSPEVEPDTGRRIVAGLAKIAMAIRHAQWAASGRRGLTPTQSQILGIVAGSRAPLGVKAVAAHLAVTMGTASEAVATLVNKGLLRKGADKADGRAVALRLTPRGRRKAASQWPEAVMGAADAMPEPERAMLLRGLVGMVRSMQARGMVPTSRMCVECRYFRPNEYPGKPRLHHCLYIDGPIGDADLRIDCAEMEPAAAPGRDRLWEVFVNGQPLDGQGPGRTRPRAGTWRSRREVHTSPKGAGS